MREVESGRVVYSESDSVDIPIVTTTSEGQLLVVFYDGSHRVKVLTARAVHTSVHICSASNSRRTAKEPDMI